MLDNVVRLCRRARRNHFSLAVCKGVATSVAVVVAVAAVVPVVASVVRETSNQHGSSNVNSD